MKKYENGKYVEIDSEEFNSQISKNAISENSRPLTADEVSRLFIAQNINTVITDDATASRAVEFHPVLTENGAFVSVGTRINWYGQLKRAAVDLWDTAENNPNNAPDLWEDLEYRNGYRIIPEVITVGKAFAEGEVGYWGDVLYRSKVNANVYTPEQYPRNWEIVE